MKGKIIGVLFFGIIGGICGFFNGRHMEEAINKNASTLEVIMYFGALLLSFYLVVILQIVLHEAGHLLFGLLSGYRFSSFRIGSLTWVKQDGKIRFKRYSVAGTGGQCLMDPPEMNEGKIPYVLYNMGGSVMNLFSSILAVIVVVTIPIHGFMSLLFIVFCVIGIGFALMNGIPMRLGMLDNDGRNALSLGKNPQALRAFWLQMRMNTLLLQGYHLKDMPDEWFVLPSNEDMKNSLIASLAVFACNRLVEEMNFVEAEQLMNELTKGENGVIGLYRSLLKIDLVYCELLGEQNKEKVDQLLDKQVMQVRIAMKKNPSILRTEFCLALIMDKNQKKAEKIKVEFEKMAKKFPYEGEVTKERELMEHAVKNNSILI